LPPRIDKSSALKQDNRLAYRNNPLTVTNAQGQMAHVFPTVQRAAAISAIHQLGTGPLAYGGGPIMPSIEIYNIYWVGALQGGGAASLTSHYESVESGLAADYAGHTLSSNNTQYYQTPPTKYITGLSAKLSSSLAGTYIDKDPFPASGCTDSGVAKPNNCITDAQLQTELTHVMSLKGWTGGLNKIFLVFTGQGEGSCFDLTSSQCAYSYYCAYHSSIGSGSSSTIYGNEPYAGPGCQGSGTSPTGDPAADNAASIATHEITESITDPNPSTGWIDSSGYEIGDKCAWIYGTNGWNSGLALANQFWNGHYYELQMEWDNHANGCVQAGP
jgi:serine protease